MEPPSTLEIAMLRSLRSRFTSDLQSFASSPSKFMILWSSSPSAPDKPPKVVSVVDSSFNPPSRAHLRIATSALDADDSPPPKRLLLLLATQNADKPTKPAGFEERLVMMTLLAQQLIQRDGMGGMEAVVVDVGVVKEPFFHAKAAAIDESEVYGGATQVYGVGFDSLLRIFDGKYYGDEGFAVLKPFLGRHKVRATLRTDDKWGDEGEQREFVQRIKRGEREGEGIERIWGERIEIAEGRSPGEEVVSSTKAREAAGERDREGVRQMCVDEVAEWVMSEGLYNVRDGG